MKASDEQPSVYSFAEIRRHKKRLKKLKALEFQSSDSDSDSEHNSEIDPDLDINLRIFETPASSTENENVIIGEIQCNVKDDKIDVEETNEKGNINSNVFKLSVNANFVEQTLNENLNLMEDVLLTSTENESSKPVENMLTPLTPVALRATGNVVSNSVVNELPNKIENRNKKLSEKDQLKMKEHQKLGEIETESEDDFEMAVDRILSDDCCDFSDNDSDLEILMSKPIMRKRAVPTMKRDKISQYTDRKLTMYDLIYDTASPRDKNESSDDEQKENSDFKNKNEKKIKTKTDSKPIEIVEKIETGKNETKQVPVPQLKVTADGEVVVDMDSLIIEQTGLSDARNALANSEVIEECGSNYTSYNKKCNYRKQWSPQDTLKFYHVLSTIGTDFSLMVTLFPGRTRTCMKRKFKREEKCNADLILKALTCKQNFDMKLLEKELRIKEAKVNKMRENSKKQKLKRKEKIDEKNCKKNTSKKRSWRRKSFFEKGIACFQES